MWELYTTGGGDFLRLVLNGVASIFGNDDYGDAITIAALCGLLNVSILAAFRKTELNISWLIAVILVYLVAFVPKKDVIINDSVVPANSSVVANVPLGIAGVSTLFSHFSHWMTGTMEVVFSMPTEITYRGNGLLFASTLVEESSRFEFTSPQTSQNFSEFWKSCVYYDLLLGLYDWDAVVRSTNLMYFFSNNTSVTRSFTYVDSSGMRTIIGCRMGINNHMATDYSDEIANAINIHGARLGYEQVSHNQAVAKYAATMPVAFQYMTGLSLSNAEIVGQNAVANSLKRGLINFASEADAPAAAQDFALARAEQERKSTFMTMGLVAKKFLPIAQHLFEASIYAIFPFVMLMAMTPMVGKVSMGYIKALFWINLWPPLYAVLHFAVSYYSSNSAAAAVIDGGAGFTTGLSIMTNTGLGKVMNDYSAVAGYLSVSIPMIAWMVVSMSGAMMAGLAGKMISAYEQPVSKASDEATSGNVKLGNTQYMNTSGFQHNTSPTVDQGVMTERLGSGSNQTTTSTGRYLDQQKSSAATSIDLGQSLVSSSQQSLDSSVQKANQAGASFADNNMAALRDSNSVMQQVSKSQSTANTMRETETNSASMQKREVDTAIDRWAESNGIQLTDELRGSIYGAVEASGGLNFLGNGATVKVGATGQASTAESESSNYQQVKDFAKSGEFSSAVSNIASAARDMAATYGVGLDDRSVSNLDSSLAAQKTSANEYSASISQVESARETLARSEEFASTFKQSGIDKLQDYAINEAGMTQGEFDHLLIRANQGGYAGSEALENIRALALDGVMNGGLSSEFDLSRASVLEEGREAISGVSTSGREHVSGVDQAWSDQVTSNNPISADAVKNTVSRSAEGTQEGMNHPESIRTESAVVESLGQDRDALRETGKDTTDRVENMRVLSDSIPGAAGIVGEQIREREIEDIKKDK